MSRVANDIEQQKIVSGRHRCPRSLAAEPKLACCAGFVCLALALFVAWLVWYLSPRAASIAAIETISIAGNLTRVYLGMGCFWELQWATTRLEMKSWSRCTDGNGGPTFVHPWRTDGASCGAGSVTSKVGYAGGNGGLGDGGRVCYRCGFGCADDYDHLGHAEVVEVRYPAFFHILPPSLTSAISYSLSALNLRHRWRCRPTSSTRSSARSPTTSSMSSPDPTAHARAPTRRWTEVRRASITFSSPIHCHLLVSPRTR